MGQVWWGGWVHPTRVALRGLGIRGIVIEDIGVGRRTMRKHHASRIYQNRTGMVVIIQWRPVHGGWVGMVERGHGLGLGGGVWGSAKPYFSVSVFGAIGVSGVGQLRLLVARCRHSLRVTPRVGWIWGIEACLNESLPRLWRDHGLEFPGCKGVDVTRLRGNQQHNLSPRQCWQLVGLK